jgi:hypothetical protein
MYAPETQAMNEQRYAIESNCEHSFFTRNLPPAITPFSYYHLVFSSTPTGILR